MTLVAATAITVLLFQTAPGKPRALISGHVVSAQTAEGIGGVRVEITYGGVDSAKSATSTAPDGTFSFRSLRGGRYSLTARKADHQPTQRLPIAIQLDQDQSRTGIEIRFYRPGVITGRVNDADGRPVIQAEVTAYRLVWTGGRRIVVPAGSSTSSDQGEFRISGLPAGRYVLSATPAPLESLPGDGALALIRTYYPSAAHAFDFPPIGLHWGQELVDMNFELRPKTSFCVAGRVMDADETRPCVSCALTLSSVENGYNVPAGGTELIHGGGYRFCGLASGAYRISAVNVASTSVSMGTRTVQITRSDLRDVDLLLGLEQTVMGHLLFESTAEDVKQKETDMIVRFRMDETFSDGATANIRNDLSFEARGLSAGTYTIFLDNLPAGGYLKELRLAGRALLSSRIDLPEESPLGELEIVVGFNSATLGVAVKSRNNGFAPDAIVVLFPAEGSSLYLVECRGRTDPNGTVTFTRVPPGIYEIYAFTESGAYEWDDSDTRQRYPDYGRSVKLGAGKRENLELSLLPDVPDGN